MIGQKVLITTDNWFIAPDGSSYKAVYGELIAVQTDYDALGIKTNAKSTNWYAQVGRMLLAGCQIHYAVNCDGVEVNLGEAKSDTTYEGGNKEVTHMSRIYDASFNE